MRVHAVCLVVVVGFLLGTNQPVFPGSPEAATIVEHGGEWLLMYGVVYYHMSGYVKNTSDQSLKYVQLEVELLDKEGNIVLRRTGYNQRAEVLEMEGASGTLEEKLKEVEPLAPGEKDFFRMAFDKEQIPKKPKFTSYRVKITETR